MSSHAMSSHGVVSLEDWLVSSSHAMSSHGVVSCLVIE